MVSVFYSLFCYLFFWTTYWCFCLFIVTFVLFSFTFGLGVRVFIHTVFECLFRVLVFRFVFVVFAVVSSCLSANLCLVLVCLSFLFGSFYQSFDSIFIILHCGLMGEEDFACVAEPSCSDVLLHCDCHYSSFSFAGKNDRVDANAATGIAGGCLFSARI